MSEEIKIKGPYEDLAMTLLPIVFMLLQKARMTPEQVDELLAAERAKFEANKPELLPDPPA